jgi:hypothetical protein
VEQFYALGRLKKLMSQSLIDHVARVAVALSTLTGFSA